MIMTVRTQVRKRVRARAHQSRHKTDMMGVLLPYRINVRLPSATGAARAGPETLGIDVSKNLVPVHIPHHVLRTVWIG